MNDRSPKLSGLTVWIALVAVTTVVTSSCSLMLDLEECSADDECDEFSQCVEGLCQETEREHVDSHIVQPTTWTSDNVYVLEDIIMVNEATLTIEPGTRIRGQAGAGLVVRRGAQIEAEGTADEPIVFTSDRPVGLREAGDWAGLALVGGAETNREDFQLRVDSSDYGRPTVGGDPTQGDCGTLEYVRVEFGGSEVEIDGEMHKALNGITLAGCDSDTTVEYVQSHLSDDDGIVAFGGDVDIRNAVATRAKNDSFGFDTGWRGTGQYLAAQQDVAGAEAIEIQNLAEDHEGEPDSDGMIYNFTTIGANRRGGWQVGLYFKRGGKGVLSHGLVQGHASAGLYVEGLVSARAARERTDLRVENTLFFDNGEDGDDHFGLIDIDVEDDYGELLNPAGDETEEDYDGFDESDYELFEEPQHNNVFGEATGISDPYDLRNPDWVPDGTHTTGGEIEAPPESEGFDPTGNFRGAFRPDSTPWTEGWTDYPAH